jgi:hypothetical protein
MASYARQSGDFQLRKMAERIQARAFDRVQELIREIPKEKPGPKLKAAGDLYLSPRQKATQKAGLSERQVKTALRIGNIPDEQFEAVIEGNDPPTAGRNRAQSAKSVLAQCVRRSAMSECAGWPIAPDRTLARALDRVAV